MLNARQEAYAQAVARGVAPSAAAVEAGYRIRRKQTWRLRNQAGTADRIAQLIASRERGGSSDLGFVINELMRLAKVAEELGSAAGLVAARSFLVEAARLKQLLPRPRTAGEIDDDLPHDEWLKKYGAPS